MNIAIAARDRTELPRGHLAGLQLKRLAPPKAPAFGATNPAEMALDYPILVQGTLPRSSRRPLVEMGTNKT